MNTLSTPLGILPVAGGVLVRLTSYPVPFAITACLIARYRQRLAPAGTASPADAAFHRFDLPRGI